MNALQDVPLTTLGGQPASLADYAGQVLLIVNVASRCGLTPHYKGLQALYAKYKEEGFAVLGFPSNDFAGQEPGDAAEIAEFCETNYGVTFPLFAKAPVTGPETQPLFRALIAAAPPLTGGDALRARLGERAGPEGAVMWNFEKFLVGRDGQVVARFAPDTTPDAPALVLAVERELFASE